MSEFPGHTPENYVPPHIPPQHAPHLQRQRKGKPPASLSKLHRPLTRFYCNDCKKKFRSRILANRNNNAVQHYCSLYAKIITRKVDSHSNKCKSDHGMGACVVKRTDTDPDSDGEDETKAAYYADKGKKRPSQKRSRGAYTKKRKRDDDDDDDDDVQMGAKRQRRNHNDAPPPPEPIGYNMYYEPSNGDGYYHQNGYMNSTHGYHPEYAHQTPQTPPIIPPHNNGNPVMPPPPEYNDEIASTPPVPMAISTDNDIRMMAQTNGIGSRLREPIDRSMIPPPPALEPIDIGNTKGNESVEVESEEKEEKRKTKEDEEMYVETKDNVAGSVIDLVDEKDEKMKEKDEETKENENEKNATEKQGDLEDEECINDENTEDEEDLPDLTIPCNSPSPNRKITVKDSNNGADDDDDLNLDIPE